MATAAQSKKSTDVVHVYSTLANDQRYTRYADVADRMNDLPPVVVSVHIAGKAGLASKNLITPMGVLTTITQEEHDAIKELEHFKNHVERGHIRVERKKAADIEAIVSNMNIADPSAPLTPADYEDKAKDGTEAIPMSMLDKK